MLVRAVELRARRALVWRLWSRQSVAVLGRRKPAGTLLPCRCVCRACPGAGALLVIVRLTQ